MSLQPLQATLPLGQFDCVDSELTSFKGGEVCTFTYVTDTSATDKAASDVFDGYILATATQVRPAVTKNFNTVVATNASRPLFLSDDGIFGYGTLLGSIVGGTVGQVSFGANTVPTTQIGPSTATGSGKITLWGQPGLYKVSLDATDGYLQPTNTALTGGDALGFTAAGLLTPVGSTNHLAGCPTVGHLVDFNTNGSLVSTPNYLVAALNSPSGNVSSVQPRALLFATIWFQGAA